MLLLLVAAGGAWGQWRIVTPNLTPVTTYFGAMCFRDGVIWIANDALYMSTDTGLTWIKKPLPDQPFDIDFYNSLNGVLPGINDAWITRDGGSSWQVLSSQSSASACFLNGPNRIAVAERSGGFIGVTTDGGSTWSNNLPSQINTFCVRYRNGTIYECGGTPASGSFIHSSNDFGQTWQQSTSSFDEDSYCFAVDSCDPNRIYVAHEDAAVKTDQFAKIYLTTDRGTTWQAMVSQPEPFFTGSIAEGTSAIYCQSVSNGVFRSTDQGVTWGTIGGPSVTFDTRLIAAINDNIVLAVDNAGNVWRTDNSGGDSIASAQSSSVSALVIPSQSSVLNQTVCSTPVDTFIPFALVGCGTPTGTLDSQWLTGSTAFQIADARTAPRTLAALDSILVGFSGTQGPDTAILHLQYNLGSGVKDTTIQLIGTVAFTAQTAQLHREAASAYFGKIDSLTLGVDLSSQINIDSLWPYITEIQFTFTWDSSVVSEYGYIQPPGWALKSLSSNGNSESVEIQNKSSVATQPLDLGTALFLPDSTLLATGWVELPSLVIDIGSQALSLCVTDNEDNHWSVKTLGVQSGVTEVPIDAQELLVYPNPAEDELFIQNPNEFSVSIELYDAIGREVLSATGVPAATTTLATQSLQNGVYFFRATGANGFSTSSKVVIVR